MLDELADAIAPVYGRVVRFDMASALAPTMQPALPPMRKHSSRKGRGTLEHNERRLIWRLR
jgi:hypothetical protein